MPPADVTAILERLAALEVKIDMFLEMKDEIRTIRIDCPQHRATLAAHEERLKAIEDGVRALWSYFKIVVIASVGAVMGLAWKRIVG